jgi:DNA-directed RNA polymerase, mitochondrial
MSPCREKVKMDHHVDTKEEQLRIEAEASEMGIVRYRKQVLKGMDNTPEGKKFIEGTVEQFAQTVREWTENCLAGKASRNAGVALFIAQYIPEQVATVVLSSLLKLKGNVTLQSVAMSIAHTLEVTGMWEKFAEEKPGAYKRLLQRMKKAGTSSEQYRWLLLRRWSANVGVKLVKWGTSERLRVGTTLIHLLAETTDFIRIETVRVGKTTVTEVHRSDELVGWLEEAMKRGEALATVCLPMVHPPKDWTGPRDGGFLTRRFPLVTHASTAYLQELKAWEMPSVYRSINALQRTPWRVNGGVMRVLKACYEENLDVRGVVRKDPLPLPPKTFGDPEANPEGFLAWKQQAAEVYTRNAMARTERIALINKLWVAERFSQYGHIYFVYQCDFRGRFYVKSDYLSPQADDVSKGLLEFGQGHPLGETGAYWLAVHGANTFGVDKVTYDERVKWVLDNQEAIVASAIDPLAHRWWTTADGGEKPFQFLAFCLEWAGLVMHVQTGGKEEDFVSHLPVGLDGSCNGLQHFSAMIRDEVGGAAVNLTPSERPSDIYSEVKEVATRIIDEEADDPENAAARAWMGKVTRKTCKRPTMTLPYGSSRYGFVDQTVELLRDIERTTGAPYLEGVEQYEGAQYFAKVVDQALGEVVVRSRTVMKWLQKVSRLAVQSKLPVRFEAPSGFLVQQEYKSLLAKEFDFQVGSSRYRLTLQVEGSELDARRMANGISPNFVHALDASHLVSTINACLDEGITSYAMVHDSYGTHAGNIDKLSGLLRRCFVEQYSVDVLEGFRSQIIEQLDPKLVPEVPERPESGSLDLEGVMESQYFFA